MKTTRRTSRKNQDKKSAEVTEISVSDTCISALHASILAQIFLKLPIGVLMKCKLVCTAWYKIITESSFTDIYEKNSPFTTLLLPTVSKPDALWCQDLYLLEISENGDFIRTTISPRLPRLFPRDMSWYRVGVGSCSGLLILSMQQNGAELVYISNPIMGEYVELPVHETDHSDETFCIYSIGFCPRIYNFKVLRIAIKSRSDSRIVDCEIFTVGVDARWRRLYIPFMPSMDVRANGVSCNGAFHWILPDNDLFQIFTFDLAEEKIDQLPHPPGLVLNPERMKLALFDKQLTLVDSTNELQITISTMKEYGIVDSWTKDVILKSCLPSGRRSRKRTNIPVGKLQNGDILFGNSGHLISFNVKLKECSRIGFFDSSSVAYCIIPYAPSFKSLSKAITRGHWNTMNDSSKQL